MWWSSLEIGVSFTFSFLLLVQHECIPQAILGMDVLCQAKSGMGKTAVFVLAINSNISHSSAVTVFLDFLVLFVFLFV